MTPASPVPYLAWSQRALNASSLTPLAAGFALAAALLIVFFAFELALGRFDLLHEEHFREDVRVAVVLCLLAAYQPAAWLAGVRGTQRTAEELAPVVRPSPQAAALQQVGLGRRELRVAGLVGIAVLVVGLVLVDWHPNVLFGIGQLSLEAFVHRLLVVFIGWFGGRSAYATWVESRRLSRLGRDHVEIDLLDLSPISPLIRHGLRSALLTIGAISLLSLMFYDVDAAPNLVWFLVSASILFLLLAATELLLPVRGVHDAIAREKERELVRVNDKIRRARDAGGPSAPSLTDWVAYRGLIEAVREWPVDAPTLRRFGLYLAIPVGSWLGGALVERLVDSLLS